MVAAALSTSPFSCCLLLLPFKTLLSSLASHSSAFIVFISVFTDGAAGFAAAAEDALFNITNRSIAAHIFSSPFVSLSRRSESALLATCFYQ